MPPVRFRVAGSGTIAAGASSLLVVLLTLTTAGCSSDPQVELNQTRLPATVTVTTTVTAPATSAPATAASPSSPSPWLTSTGTNGGGTASRLPSGPTSPTVASANSTSLPGDTRSATQAGLIADYRALTRQVAAIDALPRTGAATGSALDDLAGRFRALRAAPVPAGVDRPSYVGRLFSLELFAAAAADEARTSSPRAAARYAVIRSQTTTLLAMVTSGLGTALALPAPGASPSPTSTGLRATPSTQ